MYKIGNSAVRLA